MNIELALTGSTAEISKTKIEPLESEVKHNTPYDGTDRGSTGSDRTIDQSRINPLGEKGESDSQATVKFATVMTDTGLLVLGQGQHTAPHADNHGVVGPAENLGKTKIPPLEGGVNESQPPRTGLDDEAVDTARINPLGGVRE
ncbi:hypothetical protein F5Y06DRAFT_293064 [Hypoxylon sp. FL0890]|nr:hypothetical protein F5Y06DRAFT_293064 [Hypoxylon sp. FL0890]